MCDRLMCSEESICRVKASGGEIAAVEDMWLFNSPECIAKASSRRVVGCMI